MATNAKDNTVPSLYLENIDEVKKVFNRFDANGDGKISATELADVLQALGSSTTEEELKRMMEEIDTDRDGYISLDEFADFCRGGINDQDVDGGAKELKDAFEMYDHDKNGLISASELHLVLNRLGEKCSVHDCSRMIGSVDCDGDGNVSFDEFKKMMSTKSKALGLSG